MNRKTGVILSYVLMIFEVLSTLLLTPFIIRTLGQAEYGVYKLAAAINAYLLLLDLGVGNAITRYLAKFRVAGDELQGRKFLGVATIFYFGIAVIAVVIGMVLTTVFPTAFAKGLTYAEAKLGQKLLSITMVNSAVTLGTAAYANVLIAYEKHTISKGASILLIIVRIILTYAAVKAGMGSIGIVIVNLAMTICCRGFFVFYVLFKIKLRPMFKGINQSFVAEIVAYSSLILLQMIATQLNATVDQVLLGAIVASSATILTIYGVGTQVVQYVQSIGSAFTSVLMPGIVRMVESKVSVNVLTDEMIRIGRIIFTVLALIWSVFLINGHQFIVLWAGVENEKAYYVAIILMTAYTFILTESIGTQILWAMNAHKEQAFLKIAIVLSNILLTVLLIKWNPLIGATVGTFISLVLGDVGVMNIIFVKKLKMNIWYYYRDLLKGFVLVIPLTIAVGLICSWVLTDGWLSFFVSCFIMTMTYAVFMFFIGMNEYEKRLWLSLTGNIVSRIGGKK